MPVPEAGAAELEGALAGLRERFPGIRWLPPASMHLTVLFLGATPEGDVARAAAAMDDAAALQAPFEIRTAAGGGRVGQPGRGGGIGVAWLNLDRGADETAHLATDLSERLQTGTAWPEKGHAPHLTIARRANYHLVRLLRDPATVPAVTWTCQEVVLFSSDLGFGVPRYEALHRAPLRGSG